MAGFKQSVLNHDPLLLITFDGDPYDSFHRNLMSVPPEFMDESGYGNNGILHVDSETVHNYRMGLPSQIELEPTDQRSCSFGWYGQNMSFPGRWTKAFIEVPHKAEFGFPDNLGSFTVNLIINKQSNEQNWRDVEYANGGSWNANLIRPWIRKAGVFYLYFNDRYSQAEQIVIDCPNGQLTWEVPAWFYGKAHQITMTWDVQEHEPDIYTCIASFYVNGHLYASRTTTSIDDPPNVNIMTPIEIAGTIDPGGAANNDRNTSNTIFDQISVHNKALSSDEVATLNRKIRNYDNTIAIAQPVAYWPMADVESTTDNVMTDYVGNFNGAYIGGNLKVLRERAGPTNTLGSSAVYFNNGGMAAVHRLSSGLYNPVFDPTGDWTVETWASFEQTGRSVIFSMQRDDYPFSGILIEANMRNGMNVPGMIELSINDDYKTPTRQTQDNGSPFNFSDGRFHHIVAIKRNNVMELWVDGLLHSSRSAPAQPVPTPGPGQIYLMAAMPGKLSTQGNMSSTAAYQYALDPWEVRSHYNYSQIYRIKGVVTLAGNPHRATVRALRNIDGQLVQEVQSDTSDGDYMINLNDNSLIDLMVLNKQDRNVRYRAYGPITPAVYEDFPT